MKKITLITALLLSFFLSAQTNPSDTTFVNTSEVQLDYFGDFDSTVNFPDGSQSYRKILMTCDLGKYDCPPSAQYCHQWDYTVRIQLMTSTDTYEMGRFITPFATSGWPFFDNNWSQPYVFDVTDFYPLLQGQKNVRIHYEGYSGGFTAKLKFAFIEGTPERDVLDIKKAYQVTQTYGDANDSFNSHLPTFTDTPPAGTQAAKMKVLVTGHGSDDNSCCEFAQHYYNVLLDNTSIAQEDIWRNDCGENEVYPQGGTWIFNRSNWCPGSKVIPMYHELSNISAGTSYNLDVQFENYTGSGSLGNYNFNAIVFYYDDVNKNVDAGVTDIIAPTNAPQHFRENPSGSIPKIEVSNSGSTAITAIDFSYGVKDSTQVSYTWNGNLPALQKETISLPELPTLTNISNDEIIEPQQFNVEITGVNGQSDDDSSNNSLTSTFVSAPVWPSDIVLKLNTSNLGANGYFNQSPADVSWTITDMNGNVVSSRTNADVTTQYTDNVNLTETGFYKLKLTSTNCFGLHWWVLDQSYPNYQAGSFKVQNTNGDNLPMHNYTYNGTPHDDWGCSYTQYFSVDNGTFGVDDFVSTEFMLYPNPTTGIVNIQTGKNTHLKSLSVFSINGRQVMKGNDALTIDLSRFPNGVYFVKLTDEKGEQVVKKVVKK